MERVRVEQLEIQVTNRCNLRCDGCQHFSNFRLRDDYGTPDLMDWMRAWAPRVVPDRFKIQGGEPLLDPSFADLVRLAAELWPDALRILHTNGLLIPRHPGLVDLMLETDTLLCISLHSDEPVYAAKIHPIVDAMKAARASLGMKLFVKNSRDNWYKGYRQKGDVMLPHDDGDSRQSWEACVSKYCMQLYANRLWKCPPITYLKLLMRNSNTAQNPLWDPYLGYQGLALDCDQAALDAFAVRQDEAICAMCPKSPVNFAKDIYGKAIHENL